MPKKSEWAKKCSKCGKVLRSHNKSLLCHFHLSQKCHREYYQKHKDKIRKQQKEYYQKNKDKIKEKYLKDKKKQESEDEKEI